MIAEPPIRHAFAPPATAWKGKVAAITPIGQPADGNKPVASWWLYLRGGTLLATLGLLLCLLLYPTVGLAIFWGLFVGVLPLVLLVAPGLWRNICPMATMNQAARAWRGSPGRRLSRRLQHRVVWASAGMFVLIVPLRKIL